MVKNADQLKKQLLSKSERKGPLFKLTDDPRIPKRGKILRKLSLDEIPQFFNVLKGQMSIVGPRPHLPEEVSKYKYWQKRLLSVKP
jgi:lipopolysaccharide/colanic/teichoic acid biosynthesis glycosyltransferase